MTNMLNQNNTNSNRIFAFHYFSPRTLFNLRKPYWQRPRAYSQRQLDSMIAEYSLHPEELTMQPLNIEIGFPLSDMIYQQGENEKARKNFDITNKNAVKHKILKHDAFVIDGQQRLSALIVYFEQEIRDLLGLKSIQTLRKQLNVVLSSGLKLKSRLSNKTFRTLLLGPDSESLPYKCGSDSRLC